MKIRALSQSPLTIITAPELRVLIEVTDLHYWQMCPHLGVLGGFEVGTCAGQSCLQAGYGVGIQPIHAGKELPCDTQALQ